MRKNEDKRDYDLSCLGWKKKEKRAMLLERKSQQGWEDRSLRKRQEGGGRVEKSLLNKGGRGDSWGRRYGGGARI